MSPQALSPPPWCTVRDAAPSDTRSALHASYRCRALERREQGLCAEAIESCELHTGDDVKIRCASAVIDQMQVGRHATLAAVAGGAVAVHGLDGSAAITTDGGDVVVQLQERSRSVEVNR